MPSILPDFTYDIFISYRHKDNAYDGWVTQFVHNLRKELEATFKEEIRIYFDENPHDGLRETHDVDESLKEKLKCLVFIPVISQTYCDTNSFAWRNEFLEFKKFASNDRFGLKIHLPNGNVASRILPVRIHDIDPEDQTLLENEIGPLRAIDFIYHSSGVNRPLSPSDERGHNLNQTYYRDQVNKSANAIKDIIKGLQLKESGYEKGIENFNYPNTRPNQPNLLRSRYVYYGLGILLLLALTSYFSLFRKAEPTTPRYVSIAVMPFYTTSGHEGGNPYGMGIASEIRARLAQSKKFEFISSMQASMVFDGKSVSPRQIRDELGVDFLLSGLYQLAGDRIRVDVELVDTQSGRSVWNITFNELFTDIFEIQANIAAKVFKEFGFSQSTEGILPTQNIDAYKKYLRALELSKSSWHGDSVKTAEGLALLEETIQDDPTFIDAYLSWISIATFWWWNYRYDEEALREHTHLRDAIYQTADKARRFVPDTWKLLMMEAMIKYRVEHQLAEAEQLILRVLPHDPENALAHNLLGAGLYKRRLMQKEAINHLMKANLIDRKASERWGEMAIIFISMGDYESAYEVLKHETSTGALASKLRMLQNGYDVPELAETEPAAYDIFKKFYERDYTGVLALRDSIEKKSKEDGLLLDSYLWRTILYFLLQEQDSANYYADRFLAIHPSPDQNIYAAVVMGIKAKRDQALQIVDNVLKDLGGQDYLRHCGNLVQRIAILAILEDYEEATQTLKKLNKDFPSYGDYLLLQTNPLLDKIKAEHPPFVQALNNLKLPEKLNWKQPLN